MARPGRRGLGAKGVGYFDWVGRLRGLIRFRTSASGYGCRRMGVECRRIKERESRQSTPSGGAEGVGGQGVKGIDGEGSVARDKRRKIEGSRIGQRRGISGEGSMGSAPWGGTIG